MASTPYKHFVPPVPINPEYDKNFSYILIESLEQLQSSFKKGVVIAWDTETTGLNPTESEIVGFSYTYDGQTGYYCPVKHFDLALGKESLDLFYQALKSSKLHLLYNARFDIRIMEYSGYDMSFLYPKDPKTNSSTPQFIDVMNQVWLADTNIPLPSLKSSTLHFLGYQPPKFLETLGDELNFQYVPAKQAYTYACLDAINTMNLFKVTYTYYKESGLASKLDNACVYIIGQLEKTPLKMDTQYLIDLRDKVYNRVLELEQQLYSLAGHPFKIGSNRELTQVFLEQGIDTGERTKAGDMKTGIELLNLYLRNHPECEILNLLIEYKEQFKFYNSYLKTLVDIAKQQDTIPPRFSYKLQSVPCLTENNLVLIKDKGITYIPDVEEQDLIWTQYGYKRVLWCNSHKSNNIYRVIFSNGTLIEGTSHHPVLVNKGTEIAPKLEWATLESLKEGERVVFNHHTPPLEYSDDPKEREFARYLEYLGYLVSINIEPTVQYLEEYTKVREDFSKQASPEFKELTHSIVADPNKLISLLVKAKPYQWIHFFQGLLYSVFETQEAQTWNNSRLEQFIIKSKHPILLTFMMNLMYYLGIPSFLNYDKDDYILTFNSSQALTLFKTLIVEDSESKYLKSLFQNYNFYNYYIEYADAQVKLVEKVDGEHTVYDIEVEDVHEYVANGVVTHNTGRLSCGKDGKNTYFSPLNLQSVPKPKSIKCYGRKATEEEIDKKQDTLGWVFSPDHPDWSPGQVVEGMDQFLNVRSAFQPEHPEEGDYVVSIDMSGEELRVVTNLFKEHNWARVINSGGDLHHANSDAIFGPENYTKETRKRAKGAAFGMLYGQEARGFQRKFPDMTLEEAQEFMIKFRRTIPSIVRGQDRMVKEAQRTGTFYTGFGRPRRVKHYLTSHDYKDVAFGKRTIMNGPIQGTAADVLKLEFIRLWDNIFTVYPEIKFICTIHDEINFSVPRRLASKVIPMMVRCMTVKMPDWVVTLDCSLSCGPTLGEQYPFKYNFETKEFIPDWEEDKRKESHQEENKQELGEIEYNEEEDIKEESQIEEIDSKMFDF